MKHILVGGDGFVGRHLAAKLVAMGEEVIVADIERSDLDIYWSVGAMPVDIRDVAAVRRLPIGPDDVVYNLAAKMLTPIQLRSRRHAFCWPTNYDGARNLYSAVRDAGASKIVQFTTDMVYGRTQTSPKTEDHPKVPLGEYGASKLATEGLADSFRTDGVDITILRPRLIIGPGRLGILAKLFKLIDRGWPVPMIGSGKQPYQFVSVFDCADASILAWQAGVPNGQYNLGSNNPPSVRALLSMLIGSVGSRSMLVPTPAWLVKLTLATLDRLNRPILDPEQYLIADEHCILDTTRARTELGWRPQFDDSDMLIAAYEEYKKGDGQFSTLARSPLPAE
ncbi:MAG: NAD-dependent epimerase/dehydratase family protein [Alphaproteobacteria bacterium]